MPVHRSLQRRTIRCYHPRVEDLESRRLLSDGALDPSFGVGLGHIRVPFDSDDTARAVVIQTDGKIVAAGESSGNFVVARLNSDGSLDPGFGNGGKQTILLPASNYSFN